MAKMERNILNKICKQYACVLSRGSLDLLLGFCLKLPQESYYKQKGKQEW